MHRGLGQINDHLLRKNDIVDKKKILFVGGIDFLVWNTVHITPEYHIPKIPRTPIAFVSEEEANKTSKYFWEAYRLEEVYLSSEKTSYGVYMKKGLVFTANLAIAIETAYNRQPDKSILYKFI